MDRRAPQSRLPTCHGRRPAAGDSKEPLLETRRHPVSRRGAVRRGHRIRNRHHRGGGGQAKCGVFWRGGRALDIEPTQLVVVGDDLQTDVRGAQSVGARAALVKTCKFRATATSTMWPCARTSRWTRGQLLAALRLGG
ncbi:MAG TPA: hypothetical protein DEQ98_03260 [Acidobacteria bacterium]|nr:hypothetical protein [Acidobacteriota bacterium]